MAAAKHLAIRRKLEALLARMRPEVSAMTKQTLSPSGGHGASELSNVPFHLADGGTDEFLHDLNATLLENEEYLTNEVRAALARLENGAFGRCEQCGKAIAAARLEAIPYARHCIKCAATASTSPDVNLDRGRPHTPADTLAPEEERGERNHQSRSDGSFVESATGLQDERESSCDRNDVHAAGTPGGGGSSGGLGGTNEGRGDPEVGELEDEAGSSEFDMIDARDAEPNEPKSGRSGGAVGGVPANKRARIK
ncbi:MAG: TraR/DksA C4-type zinc finger protein [Pirellulales bacterium]|nr:TraR/DksA C4-type zinc finger protein [Pirellulales bacterium]